MSIILDQSSDPIARRISGERKTRRWSLAELATHSGVSKAMLSKIERSEVSPTAQVLLRIATAFDMTLAELLTETSDEPHLQTHADQPFWIDPATAYQRRQVYLTSRLPLELVEVTLPPQASVAVPSSSYAHIRQVVWVIDGTLTIVEGQKTSTLATGDRLEFGPPTDSTFANETSAPCRYLVAVIRQH